jgi:hypothetical protein
MLVKALLTSLELEMKVACNFLATCLTCTHRLLRAVLHARHNNPFYLLKYKQSLTGNF